LRREGADNVSELPFDFAGKFGIIGVLIPDVDHENFPKTDGRQDNSTMPAVPSRDKLGRQPVEAFLLRTLQDD
jgi:hypothetical protein